MVTSRTSSRKLAIKSNALHYYSNKPCKNGHMDLRWTKTGQCTTCYKKYAKDNSEQLRKNETKYRENNREKRRTSDKLWRENNKGKKNFQTAKRRAAKLLATPRWANMDKIKEIYKNCPEGHEVDHIVPLQGINVCGLHVENNLQYLTKLENKEKGNKWEALVT